MNSRKESGFTYIVRTAFCYALSILIAIAFITIISMGLDAMQMAGKSHCSPSRWEESETFYLHKGKGFPTCGCCNR